MKEASIVPDAARREGRRVCSEKGDGSESQSRGPKVVHGMVEERVSTPPSHSDGNGTPPYL